MTMCDDDNDIDDGNRDNVQDVEHRYDSYDDDVDGKVKQQRMAYQ